MNFGKSYVPKNAIRPNQVKSAMSKQSRSPEIIRLLFLSWVDEEQLNAQQLNAKSLIPRLNPDKFHISVFHRRTPEPAIANRPNTTLIPLYQYDSASGYFGKYLSIFYSRIRYFFEILRKQHVMLVFAYSDPLLMLFCKLGKYLPYTKLIISTIEGGIPQRKNEYRLTHDFKLQKTLLESSNILLSVSKRIQKDVRDLFSLDSGIIGIGYDPLFIPDASRRESGKVVFVGALKEYKRPMWVLHAAERFPEANFVLIGDGPLKEDLRSYVMQSGLKNVVFKGNLPQKDVAAEMKSASVFFYPSYLDGMPKVVIEASASGIPVIVCKDWGPESVIDGETGFITGGLNDMLNKLDILLSNKSLRERMGKSAAEYVREKYSWDTIARQWEKIIVDGLKTVEIG